MFSKTLHLHSVQIMKNGLTHKLSVNHAPWDIDNIWKLLLHCFIALWVLTSRILASLCNFLCGLLLFLTQCGACTYKRTVFYAAQPKEFNSKDKHSKCTRLCEEHGRALQELKIHKAGVEEEEESNRSNKWINKGSMQGYDGKDAGLGRGVFMKLRPLEDGLAYRRHW